MERIYIHPIEEIRQLYWPAGSSHMRSVLERFAEGAEGISPSKWVLEQLELEAGSYYLTVPFDCPERFPFDDLDQGYFFQETTQSRLLGERHQDEVFTQWPVNEGIQRMVGELGYQLVFERNNPPLFARSPAQSAAAYAGKNRTWFSGEDDEETLVAACRSIDELRYVVRSQNSPGQLLEPFTESWRGSVVLIACAVFDWSGYLLWYP